MSSHAQLLSAVKDSGREEFGIAVESQPAVLAKLKASGPERGGEREREGERGRERER